MKAIFLTVVLSCVISSHVSSQSLVAGLPQRKPVAKRPVKPTAKVSAKPLPKIGLIKPAAFPALRDSWKGQVVVLNLWATWCAPCVAEMPEFVKLHNQYNGKGLKVVAISADDVSDANTLVARFVRDKGLPFEIAVMDTDDPQQMIDLINKDWPGTLPSTFPSTWGRTRPLRSWMQWRR